MNQDIKTAMQEIQDADAVLISASNGLSIAEGYHIFADNEDYRKYFGKFRAKYGVGGIIPAMFSPMSRDDKKAFMQTVCKYLIDDYKPTKVFADLLAIVKDKDYFVITSNADKHFQMNGFDPERIFEIEGTFDGMQEGSAEWKAQEKRFNTFVAKYADKKLVQLELGIGARNQMIKAPLMNFIAQHPTMRYITLNMPREINVRDDIADRTIALPGNIATTFRELLTARG